MDTQREIEQVAKDLYVESGMKEGHDLDNWLRAEQLVFTWHEPDLEREQHVGGMEIVKDEHVVEPTNDEVVS
jgi:Protein of unknown function (DUF2934)